MSIHKSSLRVSTVCLCFLLLMASCGDEDRNKSNTMVRLFDDAGFLEACKENVAGFLKQENELANDEASPDPLRKFTFDHITNGVARLGRKYVPWENPVFPMAVRYNNIMLVTSRFIALFAPTKLETSLEIPENARMTFSMAVIGESDDWPVSETQLQISFKNTDGQEFLRRTFYANDKYRSTYYQEELDLNSLPPGPAIVEFAFENSRGEDVAVLLGEPMVFEASPEPQLPNILLVSLDTLRADHLGSYGHTNNTSPFIDTIAAQGVLFLNAYSQSKWTLPSHKSMLTGLYPGSLTYNAADFSKLKQHVKLPATVPTLASYLKQKGYHTVAFTEGGLLSSEFGFQTGFDQYVQGSQYGNKNIKTVETGGKTEIIKDTRFFAAKEWMQSKGHRTPFFMFLHTYRIHTPYTSGEKYEGDIAGAHPDVPDTITTEYLEKLEQEDVSEERLSGIKAIYDRGIRETDRELEEVFAVLRQEGLLENTLVIITSDHGEAFKEHGFFLHTKILHEEVLRVPMIFYWPGKLQEGKVIEEHVGSVDIVPTILDLLEIKPALPLDGSSLKETLQGQANGSVADKLRFSSSVDWFSAFDGRYRRHLKIHNKNNIQEMLYDISNDPFEQKDLLTTPSDIEVTSRLQADLLYYIAESFDTWNLLVNPPPSVSSVRISFQGITLSIPQFDDYLDLAQGNTATVGFAREELQVLNKFPALILFDGTYEDSFSINIEYRLKGENAWRRADNILQFGTRRNYSSPVEIWDGEKFETGYSPNIGIPKETLDRNHYFLWKTKTTWERIISRGKSELSDEAMESLRALGYLQ